jgi:hypothetical protein
VAAVASGWTGSGTRPLTEQTVGTFLAAELPLTLGTFATATTGGLALFFLLLRRRRSEPQLATAQEPAATATAPVRGTATSITPSAPAAAADGPIKLNLSPIRELVPPIDPYLLEDPDERLGPSPDEAGIPRWLRPSVRSARMGTLELRQRDWKA